MKAAKRDQSVNPNNCFEIVLEDRGIAFELPTAEKLCSIIDNDIKKVRICHPPKCQRTYLLNHSLTWSLNQFFIHSLIQ